MKELNLTATGREQARILTYLKDNVSEILAGKINNGVYIEKDGKRLLSKKNLDGFMKYACEEARKQSEKNSRSACIDDPVVFGWAIHYFEEDSIEGVLYNEDGSEYKPITAKPKNQPKAQPQVTKKQNTQASIFDILQDEPPNNESAKQQNDIVENYEDDDDDYPQPTPEEVQEILAELDEEDKQNNKKMPEWYKSYINIQKKYPAEIVAYRLGDFYEILGNNAVIIADESSLTLTSRDCGLESRVPMIGFPYHVADNYFNKIRKTHSLIVVENINDMYRKPKQIIDRDTGEITDDISLPNTHINEKLLAKLSDILGDVFIVR